MGILAKIFGSDKVIEKGLELIDDVWTSDSEAQEDKRKMLIAKAKSKSLLLEAYAPFKVAQRYLSVMFGVTYIVTYVITLAMYFLGYEIKDIIHILEMFKIDWIMLTIVAFYFSGGAVEGIIRTRQGNKD